MRQRLINWLRQLRQSWRQGGDVAARTADARRRDAQSAERYGAHGGAGGAPGNLPPGP